MHFLQRLGKESPWDGGTRVACMVSGGFIEPPLRGTVSHEFIHVADWYATLSTLVGVDPSDVYNGHEIDSLDIWPLITGKNRTNKGGGPMRTKYYGAIWISPQAIFLVQEWF